MSQKSRENTIEPDLRKYLYTDMNWNQFVSSDIHYELVAELKNETVRFPVYKLVGVRERWVEELSIGQDRIPDMLIEIKYTSRKQLNLTKK